MTVSSLLDRFRPETQCRIALPGGGELTFSLPGNFAEARVLDREAAEFARLFHDGENPFAAPHPGSDEAAITAFYLARLSVEPKFSQMDALELLAAPFLVEFVMGRLNQARMRFLNDGFDAELAEGKADCSPTSPGG